VLFPVSFWVLALDRDLRIASDVLGNIYVRDPTGIKVKLWEQILFTGAGSKRYSLPLSRYARAGLWTIEVVIEGEIFSRQVNVTTRPFPTERKVAIAQRHYVELRFMSEMKKTYKPGLPFVGMIESVSSEKAIRVRVKVLDDITALSPEIAGFISDSCQVQKSLRTDNIQQVWNEESLGTFTQSSSLLVLAEGQAELVSVDGKEIDSHYVLAKEVIKKWTSNSDCYLLIEGIQHTLEVSNDLKTSDSPARSWTYHNRVCLCLTPPLVLAPPPYITPMLFPQIPLQGAGPITIGFPYKELDLSQSGVSLFDSAPCVSSSPLYNTYTLPFGWIIGYALTIFFSHLNLYTIHYMVVTEGHVTSWSKDDRHEMSGVTVGQHIFDNATSTSVCKFNFTFGVDSTMAPVSNLVVYYVDENQTVVTDLASFRVNLSNNKISTIFDSEKQYAPGEKIEMQVFAEHDSTVCLIGGRGGDSSFEHRFPYKELDLSQSGVSLFDSAPCVSSSPSSHHPKHRHHHYSVFPDVAMDSTWLWRCFNYTDSGKSLRTDNIQQVWNEESLGTFTQSSSLLVLAEGQVKTRTESAYFCANEQLVTLSASDNHYKWLPAPRNKDGVFIAVTSSSDVMIVLSGKPKTSPQMYTVTLGMVKSWISRGKHAYGVYLTHTSTPHLLSQNTPSVFWITWDAGLLTVGRQWEPRNQTLLQWPLDKKFKVNNIGFKSAFEHAAQFSYKGLLRDYRASLYCLLIQTKLKNLEQAEPVAKYLTYRIHVLDQHNELLYLALKSFARFSSLADDTHRSLTVSLATSNMELTDTLELRTNSAPCPLELPSLPTKVFVYSTGAGCATIQGLVTYSTYSVRSSNSVLDIRGEVLQEYLPGRPPSSGKYPRLLLKTCLRWKGQKPSGGVKVEVSLFSGFRLESVQHVNTADMTYDSRGDQIWFVFPNIKSSCVTCVEYFVLSHFTLESLRPAFVRAYPSSQPFMEVASFFHAKLSSPLTEGATGDDFETWFGANYTEPQNIFQNQCECHRACHKNNHRNKNHTTNTKPAIQSSATLESSTQTTDTKLAIQPSSTPESAIQPSSTPDSAIQSESTPPVTKSPSTTTQSSTTSIKTPEIESGNLKITRENFNKKVMKKSPNNLASTLGYSAGRSDISDNVTEDVNARKSVETSENHTGETSVNGTKIVDKISKPLDKTMENARKTIDATSYDSEKVTRDVNATKTNTEDKQPGIDSANARRAIHRSSDLSKEAENTNGKESYSNSRGANSNANETNSKTNETSSNSKETISNINGTNSNTNKTNSNTSKTDTRNKIPMDTVNPTTPRYEDHSITFVDNSEDEGVNRTNELVRTKSEPKIVIDDIVKEHFVVTFAPRIIVDKKSNTGPVGGDVNVKQVDVITKVANLVVEPESKKSSGLRDIVGADSKESSGLRDETNENISVKNVAKENEIAKVTDIARDKSEKSLRDQTNEKTSLMKVAKEKSVDKNHDMTGKIQRSPKKLADSKLKKLVDTKVKKYNNVINTIIKLRQANTKELEAVKTQGKSPVKRDTSSQNKRSTTEVTTTLGIPKISDVHTTADAETTTEFPKTTTYIPKTNNEFSETITTHIPKTTTEFTEKITTHIPKTPTTEFPKTTIGEVPETTTTRIPTTSDIPKTKLEPFTPTTSETLTPSEPTIDTTNIFQTTQQNEIPDTEHQRAYFHLIQSDEITITKPLGAGKLVSNSRTEDRMETSNSVGFGKADSSIGTDNSPLGTESSPIGTAEPSSIGAYTRPVGNEDGSVGPNYGPFGTAQNSIGSSNTPHGRSINPIQSSSGSPPESVTVGSPIHFSLNDPSIPIESSESSISMKISTLGSSDLNPIGRKEPLTSINPVGTREPLNPLEPRENPRLMGLSEPLAPIGTGNPDLVGLRELLTPVETRDGFRSIGSSQSFVQSSSEVPIQSLTSEVPTESLTSDVPTQSSTESPTQSSPSQRPSEPSQVTSTLNPTPKLVENITHRTLTNPTPRLDENITPQPLPNSTPKLVENITPQSLPNPTPRLDEIITPRALPIAEDKQLDEVVLDSDTVDAEDTVLIRQERVKKTVSL
ncbi:uncharacterized protein LOC113468851, partial [Diaphorina citri]|uniref:Uncharacterized protein LOC113468851 n=1 Tax=Diaphorina citri TaxID=121845 RepID=A0A3Q0J079_DIACI